jgi:flagellin
MSTINTNVPSVTAQRHLMVSQHSLAKSLERLSSGLRINRGSDDPAGLIVSERLRNEIAAVGQAIHNSERAINVIATTEGALNEVSALVIDIQALIIEAANTGAFSDEEIAANQLQIDSAIDSIARIANTTTFAGRKLLNGELDYITSGVNYNNLRDVNILGAKFGTNTYVPVEVNVTTSAQTAGLVYQASAIPTGQPITVTLAGPDGIVTLTFPAEATVNDVAASINGQKDATGVSAVASTTLWLNSLTYGSDAFVSIRPVAGGPAFDVENANQEVVARDAGRDAIATINGASTIADGLKLKLSNSLLKLEVTLDPDYNTATTPGTGTSDFAITEGGALFQLGPEVNTNLQENIGVKAMHPELLGSALVGYLSQLKSGQSESLRASVQKHSFKTASDIIGEAIDQVSILRGRLGAFERNTLRTNINQLQITVENLTSSESVVRDTDFAEETSELTRSQILVQAGNSVLAIANAQSQNVLALLGG